MDSFEKELRLLIKNIILSLRPEKKINREAFDNLYSILEQLRKEHEGKEFISRKTAGMLFYLHYSILIEANHTKNPDQIMEELWRLSSYLLQIYDENIIQSNPKN